MSQEETTKSARPGSISQSEQSAEAVDAELNEALDDSQLEAVAGGTDSNYSKKKQIEDISKWGG